MEGSASVNLAAAAIVVDIGISICVMESMYDAVLAQPTRSPTDKLIAGGDLIAAKDMILGTRIRTAA